MAKRELIYSTTDTFGVIEVFQDTLLRTLHFGTPARQSAMYPDRPYMLPLSYSRYMLAPLLFVEKPHKILVLGLGAGSLLQFFHHYTGASIDTVELRQAVVEVAMDYFRLPADDPRLRMYVMPADVYLQQAGEQYELCLVDIYNDQGIDETLLDDEFYINLATHMQVHGLCCFNLWASHPKRYTQIYKLIRKYFPHMLVLPVPQKGNVIIIAATQPFVVEEALLQERALRLEAELNIEFRTILKHILTNNRDKIPH